MEKMIIKQTRAEYSLHARLNALYLAVREAELLSEGDRSGLQFALKARMVISDIDYAIPTIDPDGLSCFEQAAAFADGYAYAKCGYVFECSYWDEGYAIGFDMYC